jgi:hypothetical protein
VYVEGGGSTNTLKTACRRGFSAFLEKAGLKGYMPRIVACGGRQNAYEDFCTAIKNDEGAMLLVDSESPVNQQDDKDPEKWNPWVHLKNRKGDQWEKPPNASVTDCHLMVQCMETWFLADRAALAAFYGKSFHEESLPPKENPIESIEKKQVYRSLKKATRSCEKTGEYDKGGHSFAILAMIDPNKIVDASPWAKRFVTALKKRYGCPRKA